jgi:hypothetical protein
VDSLVSRLHQHIRPGTSCLAACLHDSQWQRWVAALVIGGAWSVSHQGILLLLLILAVFQAFQGRPEDPDHEALGTYAALVIALAWLSSIKVVMA